jgi:hypothetical protein
MTTDTETQPNPYKSDKGWSNDQKGTGERGITTANSMYSSPKKQTDAGDIPAEDSDDKPYQKVDYKKRYDSLKKHHDKRIEEFKAKEKEWVANTTPKYEVPKTPEELANFKAKHPEVYDTIETVAYQMSQKQVEEMREKLDKVEKREESIKRKEAEGTLEQSHPDFREIRNSPVFHNWVSEQPEEIRNWLYKSIDPKKISKALTLFKNEVEWSVPKNVSKADAAKTVPTKATGKNSTTGEAGKKKVWTTSEIKKLSVYEFDHYSKDIDKAYQEGRVIRG